jgi:hypothetical protein
VEVHHPQLHHGRILSACPRCGAVMLKNIQRPLRAGASGRLDSPCRRLLARTFSYLPERPIDFNPA